MMLRDHDAKVGRVDAFKLDPMLIKIDPAYNIRDMKSERTRAHIEEIKVSLRDPKLGGIKKAIEVRMVGEDVFVTDGECRLTAVHEVIAEGIAIPSVVCIQERSGTDPIERVLNFATSGQVERYTELEMAHWCRRADRAGATHEQIAAAAGWKATASVTQHLKMLEMDPEVQGMVKREEVSATLAVNETRKSGTAAVENLKAAKVQANASGKTKVTQKHVASVTGRSSKQKEATDRLLDFASTAGKIADEAKRVGGVDKIDPKRLAELAQESVTTLARAKGEKVSDPPQPEPNSDLASGLPATSETSQPAIMQENAEVKPPPAPKPEPMFRDADEAKAELSRLDAALAEKHNLPPEAFLPPASALAFPKSRPSNRIDELLLEFISVDCGALAVMHAQLNKEYTESNATDEAQEAQGLLVGVANNIGALRFPEQWEGAKANSELQAVA